jgi:hypothetical protein
MSSPISSPAPPRPLPPDRWSATLCQCGPRQAIRYRKTK